MPDRRFVCAAAALSILLAGVTLSAAAIGDCNNNGVADASEALWANRDDDGDGVCNGVDNCPDESNADQSTAPDGTGAACQMQAITVPAVPASPAAPHPTYSGATVTLKGIARYGGNQYMWDFGDGTSATAWLTIADPYNLGTTHTYVGATGARYTATLSVRDSSRPSTVASASYPVQVYTASDLSNADQLRVRAQMAVDQALWYLHVHAQRTTATDVAPGYRQAYAAWSSDVAGCAAVDAFERHGSLVTSDRRTDPYVEDVRRGMNRILANSGSESIGTQRWGNPDVNANGIGIHLGGTTSSLRPLQDVFCALALVDSGAAATRAATGPNLVYNRKYSEIAQDAVDWFSWGQVDAVINTEGGWGFSENDFSGYMNHSTWPFLVLPSAEAAMGVTIPSFVRLEGKKIVANLQSPIKDASNGGWGYGFVNDQYVSIATTSGGLLGQKFAQYGSTDLAVKSALGFVYRDWNGLPNWSAQDNLGDGATMFALASALTRWGFSRVIEFDYVTNTQTANSFDWFFTPPGQTQTSYGKYLVTNQAADGSWTGINGLMGVDAGFPYDVASVTAVDAAVLMFAPTQCGNGLLEAGEQCDLGVANGTATTCCTVACRFQPASTACDDGSLCTGADVCAANGICAGTPVTTPPVGNSVTVSKAGGTTASVQWTAGAYPNNVYRGQLLTGAAWSYNQTCFARAVSPPVTDATPLGSGTTAYYLVSNGVSCPESILGTDSGGAPVPNTHPCP